MKNEMIQYLPEAIAAVTFVAGVAVDRIASERGDAKREAALHTQGVTEEALQARRQGNFVGEEPTAESEQRSGKLINRAIGIAVPTSMALAAGLSVSAWMENPQPESKGAVLNVVAQHDYASGVDGSARKANSIVSVFNKSGTLKLRAVVAHNGSYDFVQAKDVSKDTPYGPTSVKETLPIVLGDAASKAAPVQSNAIGSGESSSAALLLAVDNDSIGQPSKVIEQAKQNGNLPIYIANVGKGNNATTLDLKKIAEKTGGKYVDASKNTGEVAKKLAQSIEPRQVAEPAPKDGKINEKLFSLMAIGLAAGLIKKRAEAQFKGKRKQNKADRN